MLERSIERLLFACRWLLAPMYLGLALALLALGVKFFQEAIHHVQLLVQRIRARVRLLAARRDAALRHLWRAQLRVRLALRTRVGSSATEPLLVVE